MGGPQEGGTSAEAFVARLPAGGTSARRATWVSAHDIANSSAESRARAWSSFPKRRMASSTSSVWSNA